MRGAAAPCQTTNIGTLVLPVRPRFQVRWLAVEGSTKRAATWALISCAGALAAHLAVQPSRRRSGRDTKASRSDSRITHAFAAASTSLNADEGVNGFCDERT
jgi:hypothetical protein